MSILRFIGAAALLGLAACGSGTQTIPVPTLAGVEVTQSGLAKQLFGNKGRPAALPSAPYGFYSKGCLAGGQQLAETGPTWQAMRLSRNRNWAHPEMIDVVQRISRTAAAHPASNGIYVGDMSQPAGGPMLTGHASHQIGLDADIWLMPATLGLSREQRENISAVSMRRANGAYTNSRWGDFQRQIVKAAAQDPGPNASSSSPVPRSPCAMPRPEIVITCVKFALGMATTTTSTCASNAPPGRKAASRRIQCPQVTAVRMRASGSATF